MFNTVLLTLVATIVQLTSGDPWSFQPTNEVIYMAQGSVVVIECEVWGSNLESLVYVLHVLQSSSLLTVPSVSELESGGKLLRRGSRRINNTFEVQDWHLRSSPELDGMQFEVQALQSVEGQLVPVEGARNCSYALRYVPVHVDGHTDGCQNETTTQKEVMLSLTHTNRNTEAASSHIPSECSSSTMLICQALVIMFYLELALGRAAEIQCR